MVTEDFVRIAAANRPETRRDTKGEIIRHWQRQIAEAMRLDNYT